MRKPLWTVCPGPSDSAIVLLMFADFTATDRWTKKPVHGRKVWVALPHPAWVEYKKRTGNAITDSLAQEIAGHYLKSALESGEGGGREMFSLTVEETLTHIQAVVAEMQA